MFGGLLGRDTVARASASPVPPVAVGAYRREDGTLAAMLGMDLAMACSSAAALTMIPAQSVREMLAAGEIPANLAENLHEVFNVCAVLFTVGDPHRLTLAEVVASPDLDATLETAATAAGTTGITVDIEGYPGGNVVLWVF